MTTNVHFGSANIYQFPAREHFAAGTLREDHKSHRILRCRRVPREQHRAAAGITTKQSWKRNVRASNRSRGMRALSEAHTLFDSVAHLVERRPNNSISQRKKGAPCGAPD